VLAVGVCLALMLPWYAVNAPMTAARIWEAATLGHKQGNPETWTWLNWDYYLHYFALCFTGAGALFMAAAAGWSAYRGAEPRRVVAGWLSAAYLICTFVPSKDTRYILPSMGALPALAASALPLPAMAVPVALSLWNQRRLRRPDGADWHNDDILAAVRERAGGRPVGVCVLPNHEWLNTTSLIWQARRAGLDSVSLGCQLSEIPEWSDFVVVKTGNPGAYLSESNLALTASTADPKSLFSKVFAEARRWDLPDGSQAVLFAQRPNLPAPSKPLRWDELKIRAATLHHAALTPLGKGAYDLNVSSITFERLDSPLQDVWVRLDDARLYAAGPRVYILGVRKMAFKKGRLKLADLAAGLSKRAKLPIEIAEKDGALFVGARSGIFTARAGLKFDVDAGRVAGNVASLRLLGLPIPGAGLARFERTLSPKPPYQPYDLKLGRTRIADGTLIIEPRTVALDD
jgi:hypothetical protein